MTRVGHARLTSPKRKRGGSTSTAPSDDTRTASRLAAWFRENQRPMPWRTPLGVPRNPYHALVSEAMLQQTQVSRVIDHFTRFIARFPTLAALASAPEREVLALWSGLGYYRRAKSLHAAARTIVADFNGSVPDRASELQKLPGIGRYTAGSIASIVFGEPAPIVDGNVMRVLLRLNGRDVNPAAKPTVAWAWNRAESLVRAAAPADVPSFNEGLMELGATVCLPPPSAPRCDVCPLRGDCRAFAKGKQDRIPRAKAVRTPSTVHCAAIVITDTRGRILIEQRPPTGMWASMWQCPTLEAVPRRGGADVPSASEIAAFARMRGCTGPVSRAGAFTHQTTHRTLHFTIYTASAATCLRKAAGRVWRTPTALADLGLSNAAKRVLALVRALGTPTLRVGR
ncbi:MAG: A/G-specific adenine glycosylase [Phycisphaerales bacterium]